MQYHTQSIECPQKHSAGGAGIRSQSEVEEISEISWVSYPKFRGYLGSADGVTVTRKSMCDDR